MSPSRKKILKFSESKKKQFCKAFECTEAATTKGFCRLHYLKKLSGSANLFGAQEPDSKNLDAERRKKNRLRLLKMGDDEQDPEARAPEEIVDTIARIDDSNPSSMIDLEDLNSFKKTGS
jgi:hypothetical protein